MLNSSFGFLLYLLLRNDVSWRLLSAKEKEAILEANKNYNTEREDYANPEKYGAERYLNGENWDSFQLRKEDYRGQILLKILERENPQKVLEVGPGAGFHSKLICEYKTVTHYTAIDIGQAFLDYLCPCLEKIKEKKQFTYNLILGEITETALADKYNLIVLFSTVHHIPNRTDLFNNLNNLLLQNGIIFCFDPSHYIPRILGLIKKCLFQGYLRKKYRSGNLSTHHMCSLGEYKKIVRQVPDLKIEEVFFKPPDRIKEYNRLFISSRWFSNEIGIVFRKTK